MIEIAYLVTLAVSVTLFVFMSYGIFAYGWGTNKKPKGHLIVEAILMLVLCAANLVIGSYGFACVWVVLFLVHLLVIDSKD